MKRCSTCGVVKLDDEFYIDRAKRDGLHQQCIMCQKEYKYINRKHISKQAKKYRVDHMDLWGIKPMSKNKECASYLGIYIGERLCKHLFNNVEMMPNSNPGYDMICNKGMKIDVKTSCIRCNQHGFFYWAFRIEKNVIADYFLCVAFDNRNNLNPLYMWLIPGNELNYKRTTSISPTTVHKWDKWKHNIDDVQLCCTKMKR